VVTYPRCHLKRRLLEEGVLANRCAWCGLGPECLCCWASGAGRAPGNRTQLGKGYKHLRDT